MKICLFGRISDTKPILEILDNLNLEADTYISEQDLDIVANRVYTPKYREAINKEQMINKFIKNKYDLIIEVPFQKTISSDSDIKLASEQCNIKYIRIIERPEELKLCVYVDSIEQCVKLINKTYGNVLLTIKIDDVHKFSDVVDYKKRVYIRTLPTNKNIDILNKLGYSDEQIVSSKDINDEIKYSNLLDDISAQYLVTNDGINANGFLQKVRACEKNRAKCIVIRKNNSVIVFEDELLSFMKAYINK